MGIYGFLFLGMYFWMVRLLRMIPCAGYFLHPPAVLDFEQAFGGKYISYQGAEPLRGTRGSKGFCAKIQEGMTV